MALNAGAACGGLAAIAGDMRKPRPTTTRESPKSVFFTAISFL
jgi:hypothetical protein